MQSSIHSLGGVQKRWGKEAAPAALDAAEHEAKGRALAERALQGPPPVGCSSQADIGRFTRLQHHTHIHTNYHIPQVMSTLMIIDMITMICKVVTQ